MTAGELRQHEKCKSKKRGSKRIIIYVGFFRISGNQNVQRYSSSAPEPIGIPPFRHTRGSRA